MAKGYQRGRLQNVLQYFWAYPDRVITIEELTKHFRNKYDRTQLMATMAHLCDANTQEKYKFPIERIQQGVWRLNSPAQTEAKKKEPWALAGLERLTVTIIKETDAEMVVVDDNTNIYRMVKVG